MHAATFAVNPGDALQREFPLSIFAGGRYELDVHAPNGFYRSFTGTAETPAVRARCAYEKNGFSLTGNLEVNVENTGQSVVSIYIEDQSYGAKAISKDVPAGQQISIVVDLAGSRGW